MKCCIIKRNITIASVMPLILILVLTVFFSFLASLFFAYLPLLIVIVGVSLAIATAPAFLKTEYEYNLEGGELSVALIRNNKSRKELFACDIEHLVFCHPFNGQPLNGVKITAFSGSNQKYVALFTEEDKTAYVIFSPSEDFIKELRLLAPLKVKLNIL